MAAFADRDALVAAIGEWMHRTDTGTVALQWIDMATERIGTELRAQANEGVRTLTESVVDSGLYVLPTDFAEMRTAKITDTNGQFRALTPVSPMDSASFQTTAANAFIYWLQGPQETTAQKAGVDLRALPASGQDVVIDYWQIPEALTTAASTNPTLLQYPNLYLYASLIEGWNWAMDSERRNQVAQLYAEELKRANEAGNKARYGTGMARGPAARFYNNTPSRAM